MLYSTKLILENFFRELADTMKFAKKSFIKFSDANVLLTYSVAHKENITTQFTAFLIQGSENFEDFEFKVIIFILQLHLVTRASIRVDKKSKKTLKVHQLVNK